MADSVPEAECQAGADMGFHGRQDEWLRGRREQSTDADGSHEVNGEVLVTREHKSGSGEMIMRPEENSMLSNSSHRENQDAAGVAGQLPLVDEQEALPAENQKPKRGRPRKSTGCIQKNSRKAVDSDASLKKEPKIKTLAKRKPKVVSQPPTTPPPESETVPETPEMTLGGRPKRRAAKVALEYLHNITKDLGHPDVMSEMKEEASPPRLESLARLTPSGRGRGGGRGRGRKRKRPDDDGDMSDDANFEPEDHNEAESEEDCGIDDDDYEEYGDLCSPLNKKRLARKPGQNGLSVTAMYPVWVSFRKTKVFRDEHISSWVFPEWIPSSSDWCLLSASEAENYLPKEKESVSFIFSREGYTEPSSLQKVKRFESLPHHPERWDSLFFAGGPVWAMEWCPLPDGAAESQYAVLYCNKGMDDRHKINAIHTEQTLVQLWNLGQLLMKRPSSSPHLAYALAMDEGCIWNMKWCPAGAWELPTTERKFPLMPRLGLLATAFSNGTIGIYSLPHPKALMAQKQDAGESSQAPLIYRVQRLMTLKLGSSQADHNNRSGQCFTLDWLPVKPHNLLAAGFCDGTVALWNLSSKSPLQRVRGPGKSVCLYPYHCFLAHDNVIRCLSWCRASSELLVTAGDDRLAKLWNLKNTCAPIKAIKRYLSTEVSWPIFWPGIFLTQDCCYVSLGQQGLHYLDSGYYGHKPHFVCTRRATVWSFSISDWINCCILGDNMGELICSVFCEPGANYANCKRTRFLVYRTEMVQFGPDQQHGPAEEEEREEGEIGIPQAEPQSYRGAVKKYYLRFRDLDLRSFSKYRDRPLMQQLHKSELNGEIVVDKMPLNALYKVCFNPNMDSHGWVLSGGQSGLVRLHCVSGMNGSGINKLIHEAQADFSAMFRSVKETNGDVTAVRHFTTDTMEVQ